MPANEIRTRLATLHALEAKTRQTEQRILERAELRLDDINDRIEELRPRVMIDEDAADEYQRLIVERGKLHMVVARARERLR